MIKADTAPRALGLGLFVLPLAVSACRPASNPDVQVSAEITDMPTVARLSWDNEPAAVAYGLSDEDLDKLTPVADGETLLLGMRADTDYSYQLIDADGEPLSEVGTLHTDPLPSIVAQPSFEGEPDGDYTVTVFGGATWTPVILDDEGYPVWFHSEERDFRVYRAVRSKVHDSVIYAAVGLPHEVDHGLIVEVGFDGTILRELKVPYLDHDMVELPDGTLAVINYDIRTYKGDDLLGNSIVEIAPDDTLTEIWTTWGNFDPDTTGLPHEDGNWSHANALDYDEETDTYTISLRNFGSICHIDRSTGELLWAFGGDVATIEPDDPFELEHQFELFGDHLLVMDNGNEQDADSRIMEYDITDGSTVWSYDPDPSVYTFVLGDTHRRDDGDTFADWSTAGRMEVVSPEHEVRWRMSLGLGSTFGYADRLPSLY